MADAKTKTDWWDAGFDAFFTHITGDSTAKPPHGRDEGMAWYSGYTAAYDYRAAIRNGGASD